MIYQPTPGGRRINQPTRVLHQKLGGPVPEPLESTALVGDCGDGVDEEGSDGTDVVDAI